MPDGAQGPWSDTDDQGQIALALSELGLDRSASWDEIRRAYRDQVRSSHPDLAAADQQRATQRTARINVAFTFLAECTDRGRRSLPEPNPPPAPVAPVAPVTLQTPPGDVFVQFLEAAYEVGDVSYMDPEAGLIQVLLDQGDPCASQLLIAIDTEAEPPTASFTLDAADATHAPPIRDIVDQLAHAMRNPAPFE